MFSGRVKEWNRVETVLERRSETFTRVILDPEGLSIGFVVFVVTVVFIQVFNLLRI